MFQERKLKDDHLMRFRAYWHRAKATKDKEVKKIKEKMTNMKEIFRFHFRFRSVWMDL